jgi:hypothetical protein
VAILVVSALSQNPTNGSAHLQEPQVRIAPASDTWVPRSTLKSGARCSRCLNGSAEEDGGIIWHKSVRPGWPQALFSPSRACASIDDNMRLPMASADARCDAMRLVHLNIFRIFIRDIGSICLPDATTI